MDVRLDKEWAEARGDDGAVLAARGSWTPPCPIDAPPATKGVNGAARLQWELSVSSADPW
jgi:hypothetical protein